MKMMKILKSTVDAKMKMMKILQAKSTVDAKMKMMKILQAKSTQK